MNSDHRRNKIENSGNIRTRGKKKSYEYHKKTFGEKLKCL